MTGYGVPGPGPGPAPGAKKSSLPLFDLIGAGLGILSFIWGFLAFYTGTGEDLKGYNIASAGTGALALSILAGALAGAVILSEKTEPARPPYALAAAVAAVLMSFGALVAKGEGASVGIGLILLLITAILQAGLFAYSWLVSTGKIAAGKPQQQPHYGGPQGPQGQQYGGPQYGGPQFGGQQGPPPGAPQFGGQQGQGGYPPPPPPSFSPPTTNFGAPPSYGSHAAPPSYGSQPPSSSAPDAPTTVSSPPTTVMPPAAGSGYGAPAPASPPHEHGPGDSHEH